MRVNAQTKQATRRRILHVAKKLFARLGFEATTTRDIAKAAEIGVGTLFNYFPTKESIVLNLISDACAPAAEECGVGVANSSTDSSASNPPPGEPLSLEEELFAQAAVVLRKLRPYRKYLHVVMETAFSPLANRGVDLEESSFRAAHLEGVCRIASHHGRHEQLSAIAIQLYWTLLTGVLAFWSKDRSPRQEDTLALLDESLAMFVGWLLSEPDRSPEDA